MGSHLSRVFAAYIRDNSSEGRYCGVKLARRIGGQNGATLKHRRCDRGRGRLTDMSERKPTELAEFLIARRARLTPQDAGPDGRPPRRRVPGLRREELARLAGVSVDYYTRLEQGRSRSASADVLDALAAALQLNDAERQHLHLLAKPEPAQRKRRSRPQSVDPATLRLLELFDQVSSPAFVLGRRPRRACAQPTGGRADHRVP